MTFFTNPKRYHTGKKYIPKKYLAQISQEQSLTKDQIENKPRGLDPVVKQIEKDTKLSDLGDTSSIDVLSGQGFKVYGAGNKKNEKIRKFISLKL